MTGPAPRRLYGAVLAGLLLLSALPARPAEPPPPAEPPGSGWLVGGSRPQNYDVELEPKGGRKGTLAASLRSVVPPQQGFVSLMRWVEAAPYRGQRLRLSAWVRGEKVDGWAGLWMRVDDVESKRALAFDNMEDRAIHGTRDWRRYQVVLDVPQEGDRIFYGVLLSGAGRAWVDDFRLEVVGKDVPVSDNLGSRLAPINLDFDHPPEAPPP